MKAYYQEKNITIYHGDCLEIMPQLEPVDLVLTDVPYGTTACKWDTIIPLEQMWIQVKRLIKANGAIVMTASQPFTTTLISSNMEMFRYEWIWNKVAGANFMNIKNRPLKTQEQILVFSKTANFTFNPIRIMRTKKSLQRDPVGSIVNRKIYSKDIVHYGAKRSETLTVSIDGMKHPIDIIKFSVHENGRYVFKHPTKKPVALFEYLIKTYTNEYESVLDFCIGSGTTLVAAKKLGRKAIGIEIEEKYCEIAADRLRQGVFDFKTVNGKR